MVKHLLGDGKLLYLQRVRARLPRRSVNRHLYREQSLPDNNNKFHLCPQFRFVAYFFQTRSFDV